MNTRSGRSRNKESNKQETDDQESKLATVVDKPQSLTLTNSNDTKKCGSHEEHDLTTIVVCKTSNIKRKRKWDKYQSCVYCCGKKAKLARHFKDMHAEESEVAEILSLTYAKEDTKECRRKKKSQRKKGFDKLRKRGNFNHNTEVVRKNRGFFIPEKRPNTDQVHTNYLFCEFCLGAYHRNELRKHVKRCLEKPSGYIIGKRVQSSASMFLYTPPSASDSLKNVMGRMLVDDVSRCAKSDPLIIDYGNKMCLRLRMEGDQHHHISNKIRELARLVLETRKCCEEVSSLEDCLMPKNFNFVIEAATELAGWNEDEGCMETPSIGIKLGHSLNKCSMILKAKGIRQNNHSLKRQADEFFELVKLSWNDEISRAARTSIDRRK